MTVASCHNTVVVFYYALFTVDVCLDGELADSVRSLIRVAICIYISSPLGRTARTALLRTSTGSGI